MVRQISQSHRASNAVTCLWGAIRMQNQGENMRRSCGVVGAKWIRDGEVSRDARRRMFLQEDIDHAAGEHGRSLQKAARAREETRLAQTRFPANRRTTPLP